ncbi:MAG: response regulator transcription factor [Pseudomonadota bacterium]
MKILIADDDRHLREGLEALLSGEGYECRTASDGVEALLEQKRFQPDLCILDIKMPRMNGLSVCKTLRKRSPFVQILMLTALDSEPDQIRGLDLGADDYIGKPFNPDTFLARVRVISRRYERNKSPEDTVISFDEFSLNTKTLCLGYQSETLAVTKRECEFLKFIFARPGEAISRDQIFDVCWHQEFVPNSRSLDQFVSTLRQKMSNQLGSPDIIKSVYGIGYKCEK